MSDKSFGDHMNRNIVKNPLLSTAVTGLSIEDLTHNAVLLPVSLNQEVITRPDQQIETQTRALTHPGNTAPNYPFGDASADKAHSNLPPNDTPTPSPARENINIEKSYDKSGSTVSKASVSTDDDFDVNEYFARLHGTRYVSAPLNSLLKEDQNANLDETEGNLEEINLNETEKSPDIQQSLTADIAQNFSQLPTVLPQVASAVFSSFSNMLNLKSREQTPDNAKPSPSGYQDVQFRRPEDVGVPLVGCSDLGGVKEVAPPPKEPGVIGSGSYRITTKKKAYAQIPGLMSGDAAQIPGFTSGDAAQIPIYNPMSQAAPSYFIPASFTADTSAHSPLSVADEARERQYNVGLTRPSDITAKPGANQSIGFENQAMRNTYIFNPAPDPAISKGKVSESQPNLFPSCKEGQLNIFSAPEEEFSTNESRSDNFAATEQKFETNQSQPNIFAPSEQKFATVENQPKILAPREYKFETNQSQPNIFAQSVQKFVSNESQSKIFAPREQNFEANQSQPNIFTPREQNFEGNQSQQNIFIPTEHQFMSTEAETNIFASREQNFETNQSQPNIFTLTEQKIVASHPISQVFYNQPTQDTVPITITKGQSNAPIIPPPPMFSNLPKRDQAGVGKTILPPSVARRILANQPVIKSKPSQITAFADNIFIPGPILDTPDAHSVTVVSNLSNIASILDSASVQPPPTNVKPPSAFAQFHMPAGSTNNSPASSIFSHENMPITIKPTTQIPGLISTSTLPPPPRNLPPQITDESNFPPKSIFTPVNIPAASTSEPSVPPMPESTSTTIMSVPPVNKPTEISGGNNFPPPLMFSSNNAQHSSKLPLPSMPTPMTMTQVSSNIPEQIPTVKPSVVASNIFTPASLLPTEEQVTNLPPPPTFFNPSAMQPILNEPTNAVKQIDLQQNVLASNVASFFDPNTAPTGLAKPVPEPPKASGNVNFRMAKKRPQYYSGPIEGVGDISNNIKPVIQPIETSSFQGTLFTPQKVQRTVDQSLSVPNVDQATVPFDISCTAEDVTPYASFELNKTQEYTQPDYRTAFDFSRETTEYFEAPRQTESKGFGIIGSLKSKLGALDISKLSAIDINKIQSSVTTFFDPDYNVSKKESSSNMENVPYGQPQYSGAYANYGPEQGNNFEIFVPSVDHRASVLTQPHVQPYDYQTPHQNLNLVYGQGQDQVNPQYYPHQDLFKYHQNQGENLPSSSFYSDASKTTSHQIYTSANFSVSQSTNSTQYGTEAVTGYVNEDRSGYINVQRSVIPTAYTKDNFVKYYETLSTSPTAAIQSPTRDLDSPAKSLHPPESTRPQSQTQSDEIESLMCDLQLAENSLVTEDQAFDVNNHQPKHFVIRNRSKSPKDMDYSTSPTDNEKDLGKTSSEKINVEDKADSLNESPRLKEEKPEDLTKDDNSKLDVAKAPLFGLSSMLADKTQELTDIENDMRNNITKEIDTIFNRNTNITFFDTLELNNKILAAAQENDDVSDLNICETCREVNISEFQEEKVTDDLTTQLIENITSPIQLLNPVEVPLTEDTPVEERTDFDSNQCAEISFITEETIETIQVQSATELLEDDDDIQLTSNIRSYGWSSVDDTPIPTSKIDLDNDENVKLIPNPIGFIGSNPLFKDTLPKNASDEIKAELIFSAEDAPIVIPRQIILPSAPPVEEDSKSDETGIDVHSIEQDASKDYPIFEEFVIEPSETDDDKIEFKEREKSSEDIREIESFTSRVEKFKKMEETGVEVFDTQTCSPIFDLKTASQTIPIASYFDTGNFAADTHYKNSLTSLPNLTSFNIGIQNTQISIPPGFEEEYQRRLSGISAQDHERADIIDVAPSIPDTSTQTRSTHSPSYSGSKNIPNTTGSKAVSKMTNLIQKTRTTSFESESIHFDSIFGVKQEGPQNSPPKIPFLFANPTTVTQEVFDTSQNIPVAVIDKILECEKLPDLSNIFGKKESVREEIKPALPFIFAKPLTEVRDKVPESLQKPSIPTLPDPSIFFSSDLAASTQETDSEHSGFNRLASYFASPTKTEHAKSFFELSQGQDHYRQDFKSKKEVTEFDTKHGKSSGDTEANNKGHKSFFELSQSQNHYIDNTILKDIPPDEYLANLNLMKDLTSIQNLEINPDQVFKTVNYFTVEYDNENLNINNDLNKGEPDNIKKETDNSKNNQNLKQGELRETKLYDDETSKSIIKKCKCCRNFTVGYFKNIDNVDHEHISSKDFKVKQCVDPADSESKKEGENNMEHNNDSTDKGTVTVSFDDDLKEEANEGVTAMSESRTSAEYTPVRHHWFYRVDVEDKSTWRGFSVTDSKALEAAYHSAELNDTTLVPTDGGRFDVNVVGRLRLSVYWSDKPTNVRRCSWFYKGTTDARYVPYTEAVAEKLEEEYRHGMRTGEWHRRLVLPNNELVVMHGPAVMVHFIQSGASDVFSTPPLFAFGKRVYRNPPKIRVSRDQLERIDHLILLVHGAGECSSQKMKIQSTMRPRVVRRGFDESEIEDVEPSSIDHLLLLCHGVGSACDMRFRSVEEVVDDFRGTSLQLLQSHYRNAYESGAVGRVEVLPISWHATLHSGEMGVDRRLARITLDSIPRLRNFTNDTVLDVLFYTSPVFCETIINTVCAELNRIYRLFCARNPSFSGGVSLGGHSLGSVILYDLLCHQVPPTSAMPPSCMTDKTYVTGTAGTGQPSVKYPTLEFAPVALYALGSPIAIFECIRGVESLGADFALPTCQNFFNIFHPYDPIAYRIEPLIDPQLKHVKPSLIPHHKGRKRMHLELKDTMARVGADIKQKLIESIKYTWSNMWKSQSEPPPSDRQLEKVVEEEMEKEQLTDESKDDPNQNTEVTNPDPEMLGKLNAGRRVDYVLQEAPFEMINEYLFAMSSHVGYWESEDTMLLMLREIYDALGVQPDCTVPQQSLTVQRAREAKNDDTIVINASEHPSTSRRDT